MAQKYCENPSAAAVPNFVIFVQPNVCGPWPRAPVTQKRAVVVPKTLWRFPERLEGRVSRKYVSNGIIEVLMSLGAKQTVSRLVHPQGRQWNSNTDNADILSGTKNLLGG